MRRTRSAFVYALVGMIGYGLASLVHRFQDGRTTTASRLSPDETIRARLVETSPTWGLDRNFRVDLEDLTDGKRTTIFGSPDEGRPVGTERLIWSIDGTRLLLVGRHFFVKEDLFLDNSDQAYLLYDLPSKQGWCNADVPTRFPQLKAEMIEGIQFTEPVRLKR